MFKFKYHLRTIQDSAYKYMFMPFVQGGILFSLTLKKPSQNLSEHQHYPILNICSMHTGITGSFGASVKHSSAGDEAFRQTILPSPGVD